MADRGLLGQQLGAAGSSTQGGPPDPRTGANETFPQRGMGSYKRRPGTKPILAPYELTEELGDERRPEKMARLYGESVGFPNMANDPFVVEQATAAVRSGLKDVFNVMEFLRNKWLILYRLWRGETIAQFQYGRAQLHSPEPFKAVETVHPRVMRSLFGNERWFRLYGHHDHHDHSAEQQERLCRDQLREMDHLTRANRFVRDGLIYGTAIQKLYWKQEVAEVRYRNARTVEDTDWPGQLKKELSEVKREEIVFDGNWAENVHIFDYFTSPNASDVSEAEWCADRSSWADHRVKQMGELGHWENLEKLRDNPGSNDISYGDEFKERKSYSYGVFDPREASWAPHIPHYLVIDWWGPLVIKQQDGSYTTKQCNVVMIEPDSSQIIARVTENPFWHRQKPYQAWKPISLEDEFYGVGLIEPIARMSLEKDMKRNLLMASAQLEANPMWLLSDDANLADGQLILQPGLTIRVPDIQNSIAPLHVPQVSDAALKAENVLTRDIRETNGTTSPVMGAQDPFAKGKTATQHTSEVDEANQRMAGMIENYERQVIQPMLHQMTWNNQQFISYLKVIRELGAVGVGYHDRYEIRPEDLIGRFLVQPLASHRLLTKQTIVQQLTNVLDRAPVINQLYGPQAVNMPKLLSLILEHGFDIRNSDEFIQMPPDEANLMTAYEEQQLWYQGNVAPMKRDDNHLRHWTVHMEEFSKPEFAELMQRSPGTAARARTHAMEHGRVIMRQTEVQEAALMKMAQMGSMQQAAGGPGGSPVAGAAGPGQDPDSPQVRRNENGRGEGQGSQAQSEATANAPNPGAS